MEGHESDVGIVKYILNGRGAMSRYAEFLNFLESLLPKSAITGPRLQFTPFLS